MPNIDISRHANDPRQHYAGVRMQQGRVLTDDDFNESERLDSEDARRVRTDVIGPAGSPDNGFKLFVDAGQLKMRAGTYYVGGLRLELEADELFNLQKDWLQQGSAPGEALTFSVGAGERFDFVWLDVWQQPVTGAEDKELLEAALGGADTSARIRTMRRARVLQNVGDVDCADAWAQLLTSLSSKGTINGDFELVPNSKLKIEPDGTTATADLCSPPVNGGYLGAENQAIRVQLTGTNQFTWGFDNGAPIYRVKLLADDAGMNRRIEMLTLPKDQAHYPLEDQVVELLPWSAFLANGQKNGELSGFMTKVNGGYNPDTKELFIDTEPPDDTNVPAMAFGKRFSARSDAAAIKNEDPPEDEYFYLRVWNRGADTTSPAAINFVPGTPVGLAKTGLQVTFTGTNLRKDDFWIIAVRPETPNTFVPWELSAGRPPHGVRHWLAPLGVIHWTGAGVLEVIDDCRPTFLPLTRLKGCCTYTVGDGTKSFGNFGKIQDAVNALPADGGKICVLAGLYDESVVIDKRVAITIHGCGPRSRVRAIGTGNQPPQPAFLITNSTAIALEDMAIESGPRSAVQISNSRHVTVRGCLIQMRDRATVWQAIFSRGDDVLIENNIIEILPREGGPLAPKVPPLPGAVGAPITENTPPDPIVVGFATRGGIQLAGGSDRVKVLNNIIRGGIWNGITLGSLSIVGSNDPEDIPDKPSSEDPCDPCKPPDLTDRPGPNDVVRYESAGDLYDIKIAGNRISDMGINGIGVVRFFDVLNGGDLIGVHGLHIMDNFITRCMRRILNQIEKSMQAIVAYGGIALAKVTDLRVLRNEIVNNGASHLEPICGVFAIIVEGLQLDDNRILNNGPKTEALASTAQVGIRGGVHIWIVLPVIEVITSENSFSSISKRAVRNGIPTCSMRDNLIVAPLGRAVTFFALGPVIVARNRLVTRGCTEKGLDLIAATVLIGNFGFSNEWTLGLILILILQLTGKLADMTADDFCLLAKLGGLFNTTTQPVSFWPPLVCNWATGKTLLTENQITLDLMDEPFGFGISSILAFSLDDLALNNNQIEISTTNVFYFVDALLFGGTVRAADNRFSETWMHAGFSAFSVGGMNTMTDNQSTHCLQANAIIPGMRVFRDNLTLMMAFCPRECAND